jgi:hypothetical protein
VIDPLATAIEGQRIGPLPVPARVLERERLTTRRVPADGAAEHGAAETARGGGV